MWRPFLHLAVGLLGVTLAFTALSLIGFAKIAGH